MDMESTTYHGGEDKHASKALNTGDFLINRYRMMGVLDEGDFALVVRCADIQREEFVAIKMLEKSDREVATREIDVYKLLKQNADSFLKMKKWFESENHICIVLEEVGPSLEYFLSKSKHLLFGIHDVRKIGRQLLECVAAMHKLYLVHADLKPDNILCVVRENMKIKSLEIEPVMPEVTCFSDLFDGINLIDFTTTVNGDEDHSHQASSDFYCAPEVILGLGWSYPRDLWGVGCILVELSSGMRVFDEEMMEKVLGEIPQQMLVKASCGGKDYVRDGKLNWPDDASSAESILKVLRMPALEKHGMCTQLGEDFTDLLRGLLEYNPSKRLTARKALQHPFFQEGGI